MANLLVAALSQYTPEWLRRRQLLRLFRLTAKAFGVPMPPSAAVTNTQLLEEYALFTARRAEETLRSGQDTDAVTERMYTGARKVGAELRHRLHVRTSDEVMAAARLAYRALEIDLKGSPDGSIVVSRCFFAQHYSPDACRLISALDAGLLAGLSGGARLEFTQRLTEGGPCCRAQLEGLRE